MRRSVVTNKLPQAPTRDQILQAVRAAMQGSRKVTITFKKDAVDYVKFLLGFALPGHGIELVIGQEAIIWVVDKYNDWGGDHNRTFTVTLTDQFNAGEFVGRLQHALERIEVVS